MRFEQKAHLYDQYAQVQKAMAAWGSKWLPEPKHSSFHVLELGAGTGIFTKHLLEKYANVEASDTSFSMLEQGAQRFPSANWKHHDAWNIKGETWDLICSSSLLQWSPRPAKTLEIWKQCLNPGGTIIANFYTEGTLAELNTISPATLPFSWKNENTWLDTFQTSGLQVRRQNSVSRQFKYKNALEFLKALHHTGAVHPQRISYKKMRRLIQDYQEQFSTQNEVHATWNFMSVEASIKNPK